jgi:hypothetical protein
MLARRTSCEKTLVNMRVREVKRYEKFTLGLHCGSRRGLERVWGGEMD